MPDLSKLSDTDLDALSKNDMTEMSDEGLAIISRPPPQKIAEFSPVKEFAKATWKALNDPYVGRDKPGSDAEIEAYRQSHVMGAPPLAVPAGAMGVLGKTANFLNSNPITRIATAGGQGIVQGAIDSPDGGGAAQGGKTGALIQTAAELLPAVARPIAKRLGGVAANKAVEAIGATKADLGRLGNKSAQVGQDVLDRGVLGYFSTPASVAKKTGKEGGLLERAGKRIGVLLERSDAAGAAKIDPAEAAVSLLDDPEVIAWRKTPGAEGKATLAEQYANTLAANKSMSLKELHDFRRGIDDEINFARARQDASGKDEVLYKVRDILNDRMNLAVNEVAPSLGEAGNALKSANQEYTSLSRINKIAQNRATMNSGNRTFGLTDTIAAAAGVATGDSPEDKIKNALIYGLGNKAMRSVGKSTLARAAEAAALRSGRLANIGQWAKENPAAFQAVAHFFQPGANLRGLTPESIQTFKENPKLLQNVQDPEIRAKIEAEIGRSPGADNPISRRLNRK